MKVFKITMIILTMVRAYVNGLLTVFHHKRTKYPFAYIYFDCERGKSILSFYDTGFTMQWENNLKKKKINHSL